MPCVRLEYEPVVLLITADFCDTGSPPSICTLESARLTYPDGVDARALVDIEATLLRFGDTRTSFGVRAVLEARGRRERLTGQIRVTESGGIRGELAGPRSQRIVLAASGMHASDWRKSSAA